VSTSPFVIETEPTPEHMQYLEDRLYEFNSRATGISDGQGLAIFVRDEQDCIVAGICGHTCSMSANRLYGFERFIVQSHQKV
jgi:NAD-dependent dihydropyrimidine dehydrogenase PreA subunit